MNNEQLKLLVEEWLNQKYPSPNQYERTFNVDYIKSESVDFISIDSEQYEFSSYNAKFIIELQQAFPNTDISVHDTQDGLSIFMEYKEAAPSKCPNCETTEKPKIIYPHCKIEDSELGEIYDEEIAIILCPKCQQFQFGEMI